MSCNGDLDENEYKIIFYEFKTKNSSSYVTAQAPMVLIIWLLHFVIYIISGIMSVDFKRLHAQLL